MAKEDVQLREIMHILKMSPAHPRFKQYLSKALDDARSDYENQEANEFLRGRVSMLKQLLHIMEN